MLVDYVRRQGVKQVAVSFKKNGVAPDAATYGASIRQVIAQLAGYAGGWRRHEVLHLAHSVGHKKARDEDVGVR
jgi:hypothetical protein